MKKISLLLLLLFGAMATFVAFQACSSDEMDEQPQTKAQLLLKKSREFAKKYGVKMELNEENIEEIAKTLTVEEMEQDYRNWAEYTKKPIPVYTIHKKTSTTNKIKLRRKVSEVEVSGNNNSFVGYCSFGRIGDTYEAKVKVDWVYKSPSYNKVNAHITATSNFDGTSATCDIPLHAVFDTTGSDISFSANGSFAFSTLKYKKSLTLHVYVNKSTNVESVSIS